MEPKKGILIAYGELFLKSKNVKKILKLKLLNTLNYQFKKSNIKFKTNFFYERIFINTNSINKSLNIIRNTFGICWFAKAFFFENFSLKELTDYLKKTHSKFIGKNKTYCIELKRSKFKTVELREKIIKYIVKVIKNPIDLKNPKKIIYIERRKYGWFLYFKKIYGQGGLPIGSQGKIACLISGGIDSPVAAYLIAKRGVENIWIHFYSFPLVSNKSIEKVKELGKIFLKFQPKLKLYLIPFSEIQTEIKIKIPSKYRILLYRRIMFKISEKIAKKEDCKGLVTGESLGQVSSQTLTNLGIIEEKVKIPILRPLIGLDKQEIIKLSKNIKTYEISIKPQEDCCSLFVPKHSTAFGKLEKIHKFEKMLNLKKLISDVIKKIEIIKLE